MIEGALITPLKVIDAPGGSVLHGVKNNDPGFIGFGEAYFSTCEKGAVKAWKCHQLMTLNLIVPVGEIRFVLYDDRSNSSTCTQYQEVSLSQENYVRLTVPPKVWIGFQGMVQELNMLLNVADITHVPDEAARCQVDELDFDWSKLS